MNNTDKKTTQHPKSSSNSEAGCYEVEQLNIFGEMDCWYKKRDYELLKPCDYTYTLSDTTK